MNTEDLLPAIYETVGQIKANMQTYHEEMQTVRGDVDKLKSQWAKLMGMFAIITAPFTLLIGYLKMRGNK